MAFGRAEVRTCLLHGVSYDVVYTNVLEIIITAKSSFSVYFS